MRAASTRGRPTRATTPRIAEPQAQPAVVVVGDDDGEFGDYTFPGAATSQSSDVGTSDGADVVVQGQALAPAGAALAAMASAEVDIQVATAHRFGRNISQSLSNARSLATMTPQVAEACYYALKRGDKMIQGPSVRLAEIMAQCWGHLRVQAEIVEETDTHIVARALAWDLLSNTAISTQARRRVTDKYGKRYNDDMMGVAAAAAVSVATRNAILAVVPRALTEQVYNEALKCAAGQSVPLGVRREQALGWYAKQGITEQQVYDFLQIGGKDDMNRDHITQLLGLRTALKENTVTLEEVFKPAKPIVPADAVEPVAPPAKDDEPEPEPGPVADEPAEADGLDMS